MIDASPRARATPRASADEILLRLPATTITADLH
jgi:hypothetical protein